MPQLCKGKMHRINVEADNLKRVKCNINAWPFHILAEVEF